MERFVWYLVFLCVKPLLWLGQALVRGLGRLFGIPEEEDADYSDCVE